MRRMLFPSVVRQGYLIPVRKVSLVQTGFYLVGSWYGAGERPPDRAQWEDITFFC